MNHIHVVTTTQSYVCVGKSILRTKDIHITQSVTTLCGLTYVHIVFVAE